MTTKKELDLHLEDKKIPRELIVKLQGKPYILKAGLEWKAARLYGLGNYSLAIDIVERKDDYVLARAVFAVPSKEIHMINYGEASFKNVTNNQMRANLLHLACTRAECRVLRQAVASGYASYEEVAYFDDAPSSDSGLPKSEDDDKKATDGQIMTIKSIDANVEVKDGLTKGEAKEMIANLVSVKKGGRK